MTSYAEAYGLFAQRDRLTVGPQADDRFPGLVADLGCGMCALVRIRNDVEDRTQGTRNKKFPFIRLLRRRDSAVIILASRRISTRLFTFPGLAQRLEEAPPASCSADAAVRAFDPRERLRTAA